MTSERDVSKSRVRSIDILKAAAIIGVVLAHIAFIQNQDDIIEPAMGSVFPISEFFYAVLPGFLVMSGYFYRSDSLRANLVRRVLPILVVFVVSTVVLTLIMYGYLVVLGYEMSFDKMIGDMGQMLIGRECFMDIYDPSFNAARAFDVYDISLPYYFLQIMIVGYLIFYPIADYVLKDWKRTAASIVILLTITCVYMETIHIQLPFFAQLGPVVAAFYIAGAFLGKCRIAETLESGWRERRFWLIFLLALTISVVLIVLFPTRMAFVHSVFGDYGGYSVYTFFLLALSCGGACMFIAALLANLNRIAGAIMCIGRETLVIFILHMFVAKALIAPFVELEPDKWIVVDSLPQAIALAVITIAIIMVSAMITRSFIRKNRKKNAPAGE